MDVGRGFRAVGEGGRWTSSLFGIIVRKNVDSFARTNEVDKIKMHARDHVETIALMRRVRDE